MNEPALIQESRDRRIARAMLMWLTGRHPGSNPIRWWIAFSNFDQQDSDMQDICEDAGWRPASFTSKQRTLRTVAKNLYNHGIVDRWILGNGELEYRESARWQYVYALPYKRLKCLAPEQWSHIGYNPEAMSTPDWELERMLDRAYPLKKRKKS